MSPSSVLKGQTEAQTPDSWRPSCPLSRKPCVFMSHLSIFISFPFSFFLSLMLDLRTKAEAPNQHPCPPETLDRAPQSLHVTPSPPSRCTVTTLQGVGEDLPRKRNESWSAAAGGAIDTCGVRRAPQSAGCGDGDLGQKVRAEPGAGDRDRINSRRWGAGEA